MSGSKDVQKKTAVKREISERPADETTIVDEVTIVDDMSNTISDTWVYLVDLKHPEMVISLPHDREFTIGRARENDLAIGEDACSRRHAEIRFVDGRWRLFDLKSTNGTRVNNWAVDRETTLRTNDRIQIGGSTYIFTDDPKRFSPDDSHDRPGGRPQFDSLASGFEIKLAEVHSKPDLSTTDDLENTRTPTSTRRSSPRIDDTLSMRRWNPANHRRIYRTLVELAFQMRAASDLQRLGSLVLDALFEVTVADGGALLKPAGDKFETIIGKGTAGENYVQPRADLLNKVMSTGEGVVADEFYSPASRDSGKKNRTSIVVPVFEHENANAEIACLVHLHSAATSDSLSETDLAAVMSLTRPLSESLAALDRERSLVDENRRLKEAMRVDVELVGYSDAMHSVLEQISLAAPTNTTVLVRGESGVGKELVARALHTAGQRRTGPYVCLNCAALPEALMESELFGHVKGAFTGALDAKPGKFELADKGTILLDEIGELSPSTQAKLLRILDGQPFERVGGSQPIKVDVRVIAATNRNLEEAVMQRQFRADLYYRLRVMEILVAPLRERKSDIPALARHFVSRFAREMGRKSMVITDEAIAKLSAYDWPGNVREFRNVIERTMVMCRRQEIGPDQVLVPTSPITGAVADEDGFLPVSIDEVEAVHIRRMLKHTGGNKSQAASILGIERSTLDRKIKRYLIDDGKSSTLEPNAS
jgi:Nif-specific regulatory protein